MIIKLITLNQRTGIAEAMLMGTDFIFLALREQDLRAPNTPQEPMAA